MFVIAKSFRVPIFYQLDDVNRKVTYKTSQARGDEKESIQLLFL